MSKINLCLETGQKRTFAAAADWPGWCRSGRDEASALQALLDYGPRYAQAIRSAQIEFQPPTSVDALRIVERQEGNQTTDFGAPAVIFVADSRPVKEAEREPYKALLQAIWQTFDKTVESAKGKTLSKGPRGGGRELEKMIEHVWGAEEGYLKQLGWKYKPGKDTKPAAALIEIRQPILEGMDAAARGEIPAQGPRGGLRWPLRYYVRRAAWHILDHVWEIEDRLVL